MSYLNGFSSTLQNTTEVMFKARNMSTDAMYCHDQAMRMMQRLNNNSQIVFSTEEAVVAAAIVAPEAQVAGAKAFTASLVMLLGATMVTLLF